MLYTKLAMQNIKKNGKFYFPYILTCVGTVAMFYIMCAMSFNDGIKKMPGHNSLSMILTLGCVVIGIFAIIFLFYTNSFLMKRRNKELGLYNILGMEKSHIAKVLFFETIYIGAIGLGFGLFFGILLDKLMILLLCKLIGFSVPLGFSISRVSIVSTTILFGCIIFLTLLSNLAKIRLAKPIELLNGGNVGEKEPKTKWFLTIIGLICIVAGYYIAITVKSPLTAITLFFVAVILVIIGTYCLFTAGSIAILKLLRKNKRYYYQTKHFTSVSGMIYRMKQNAVGLANICILSTMVLVIVSTTVCMYMGVEDSLDLRYPKDCIVHMNNVTAKEQETALQVINNTLDNKAENISYYTSLGFGSKRDGDIFDTANLDDTYTDSNVAVLEFLTEAEYARMSGQEVTLSDNEALVFESYGKLGDSFTLFNKTYTIKEHLKSLPIDGSYSALMIQQYYIVVNSKVADDINIAQQNVFGEKASTYSATIMFDLDCADDKKAAIATALSGTIEDEISKNPDNKCSFYIENRQANEMDFYAAYGGFLFLGLFLGTLFLMATALIIYYKQISEGYDDKIRFEIMQKVGMSKEEVKSTIRSQVLKIFFLPIIVAAIHVAGAFNMITRLLALFSLTNVNLFFICTTITILIFIVIYAIVYVLTAKVYYKIVE